MKGVVFTELLEMVEDTFGMDMVDDIIDESELESGGSYTSVGTYPFNELLSLVTSLSNRTGLPVSDLVHKFGLHLSNTFVNKFSNFFQDANSTFELLKNVDNHIHVEVRKLYPDAELPKFSYEQSSENNLTLFYQSVRNLPDLAHGLIEGTAKHYGENISIERRSESDNGQNQEVFLLSKH